MAQDTPLFGPRVLKPENVPDGLPSLMDMLSSDMRLQSKFPFEGTQSAEGWHPPMALPFFEPAGDTGICVATDFALASPANVTVPEAPDPAPAEEEKIWDFSGGEVSRGTKDLGVRSGSQRGVREYLASGYTRRNPDGTDWSDNDFAGKWRDAEFTVAQAEASKDFFDVSVADGSFGEEGDFFSGSGRVLGADSDASASFELGSDGFKAGAGAQASGSFLEGKIESDDSGLVAGDVSGSVVSGDAKGDVELVLSPEQATLKGELGAEVNLVEIGAGGDIYITPRRVANPLIALYNSWAEDDFEELSESWDIGIMVGGEVSGQIGAQAGVDGQVGYEKGRATAEAGAKIGLGLGASVKGRAGLVGLDKIWNGIKSGWNAIWND